MPRLLPILALPLLVDGVVTIGHKLVCTLVGEE